MADLFDLVHPDYAYRLPRWTYAAGAYAADYLDVPTGTASGTLAASADLSTAGRYVPRVPLGEHVDRYRYMLATLDPDGLFPYALGSLAGQVAAVEPDAARAWSAPNENGEAAGALGDADETSTPAYRLSRNADGKGTNWEALWTQSTTDLLLYQGLWFVVKGLDEVEIPRVVGDPVAVERPSALLRLRPMAVPYWREVGGLLVEAHVARERTEMRDGQPVLVRMRRVYQIGGYQDWEKVGAGEPTKVGSVVPYAFFEDAARTTPCLPVYPATLPLRYYVAYVLARKAMAMLNQSARGDVATLVGSVARLVHKSSTQVPEGGVHPFLASVAAGASAHVIGVDEEVVYVEPQMGAAQEARARAEWKRKQFLQEAYQRFGDSAREATATEVRQQQRSGVGSVLTLVSGTLDEAESRALWLLSQAERPDAPQGWGQASVSRSTDFVADDEAAAAGDLAATVFGEGAPPLGETAQLAAMERYCDKHALAYSQDEMKEDLQAWRAGRGMVSGDRREEIRRRLDQQPA